MDKVGEKEWTLGVIRTSSETRVKKSQFVERTGRKISRIQGAGVGNPGTGNEWAVGRRALVLDSI